MVATKEYQIQKTTFDSRVTWTYTLVQQLHFVCGKTTAAFETVTYLGMCTLAQSASRTLRPFNEQRHASVHFAIIEGTLIHHLTFETPSSR